MNIAKWIHNTCQNSNLNEDISSPWTYGSKGKAVGQQFNQSQQLLLWAGQPQPTQPEHRLTAATRERHNTRKVGGWGYYYGWIMSAAESFKCQTSGLKKKAVTIVNVFLSAHPNSTALKEFISVVLAPHTKCPIATSVLESSWLGLCLVEFSTVVNSAAIWDENKNYDPVMLFEHTLSLLL